MTIIAIDPGASGGIAIRASDQKPGEAIARKTPPTLKEIADILSIAQAHAAIGGDPVVCYIEEVPAYVPCARPKNMFQIGRSFGALQGILATLQIRTIFVRPQKWQSAYSIGKRSHCASDSIWKNKLKAEAQRRFPSLNVTLQTADALLLLDYAITQERNQAK
jgi:hypothetical protein